MPENENTKKFKALLKDFGYYLVDFFISVLIGLGVAIVLNVPMKFLKLSNIDLCSFIVSILSMCIALYIRSYSRSYNANTRTYTFRLKRALQCIAMTYAVQIAVILLISGHAVYVSGPTCWLSLFILPDSYVTTPKGQLIIAGYDWMFMLLADLLIYAPIMVLGEYLGDKQNKKEIEEEKKA